MPDWTYHDGRGGGYRVAPRATLDVLGDPTPAPGWVAWQYVRGTEWYPTAQDGPELIVHVWRYQHKATHAFTVVETDVPKVHNLCPAPEQPWWYTMEMQPPAPLDAPLAAVVAQGALLFERRAERAQTWGYSVLEVQDYHHTDNPDLFVVRGRYHIYRAWYWERVQP